MTSGDAGGNAGGGRPAGGTPTIGGTGGPGSGVRLDGKVALVTGGASGIGLASARRFARAGATVVVVDLDGDQAAAVAAELGGAALRADVASSDAWPSVIAAGRAAGGIDIVHLNAGVTTGQQEITELTDEEYRRIMGVNVDHVVFGTRACVPEMAARGGGAIVVTASLAGLVALPGDPVYTLSKHAVVGFVRAMAPRLQEQRITMNAVCPGMVDTPLLAGEVRDLLVDSGFPLIDPDAVAGAVVDCATGGATGMLMTVQAGSDPVAYRFARPPGPRVAGAEGRVPPGWLGDAGQPPPVTS